ncbi:FCD domain-containing protein [Mesorhizobium sp. M0923]|uniref:FCD domain-containing protein n=1 Tax=unclassified Mesorhizobium TaxID=325217 RepID=UPI0033368DB4
MPYAQCGPCFPDEQPCFTYVFCWCPNLRQNPLFHSGSYLRANYASHFSIYRAAGSENMLNIIENLWLQISPYFNMLHDSGNYSTANQHHQQMFAALRDRNAEAVRAAVRADIDAAFTVLIKLLK